MSDSVDPDSPSVWWPCPECGGIHFRTVCVFERGEWQQVGWNPERFVYAYDSPANGRPNGIDASDVECLGCGHRFNIADHYDWPIVGEYEA